MLRDVIEIDEAKCDGCGDCVTACAEGAIAVIGGKAKLVSDVYCDGLGACLGTCPRGAITVVKRDAAEFDQAAVDRRLAELGRPVAAPHAHPHACPGSAARTLPAGGLHAQARAGCPGSSARELEPAHACACDHGDREEPPSQLGHWPIQLGLAHPGAPWLQGADVLLTAHCVPVALPDFHRRWVADHVVLLACPKLDDLQRHTAKLAAIMTNARPASITVLRMEVPCCGGLQWAVQQAAAATGWDGRIEVVTVTIDGHV